MAYDPNDNYIEETQLIKKIRVVTLITSFVIFGISLLINVIAPMVYVEPQLKHYC